MSPSPRMGPGELNALLIPVDTSDARHQAPQAAGERPGATADVECLFTARGDDVKDHAMVVKVMAPRFRRSELPRPCHARLVLHDAESATRHRRAPECPGNGQAARPAHASPQRPDARRRSPAHATAHHTAFP